MKAIVTCGPSYEPIDRVRRITNFSSGELGVLLSESLARAGHEVICLKGTAATYRDPIDGPVIRHFDTNDDLLRLLQEESQCGDVDAIFHAAALCDYKVSRVRDQGGEELNTAKIPSRAGGLSLELEPATKVIRHLRDLFPQAALVGWKYELAGSREEAVLRSLNQLREARSDACVVNGSAFGTGFGFCDSSGLTQEWVGKGELVDWLTKWLPDHGTHSDAANSGPVQPPATI